MRYRPDENGNYYYYIKTIINYAIAYVIYLRLYCGIIIDINGFFCIFSIGPEFVGAEKRVLTAAEPCPASSKRRVKVKSVVSRAYKIPDRGRFPYSLSCFTRPRSLSIQSSSLVPPKTQVQARYTTTTTW